MRSSWITEALPSPNATVQRVAAMPIATPRVVSPARRRCLTSELTATRIKTGSVIQIETLLPTKETRCRGWQLAAFQGRYWSAGAGGKEPDFNEWWLCAFERLHGSHRLDAQRQPDDQAPAAWR